MLLAWITLAGLALPATPISLERGAMVNGHRYVAIEDTTLDLERADEPQGGNSILESGGGKAILIQFRELRATLGRKRVTAARLEFTVTRGKPTLSSVRRMLVPWTEGSINSIAGQIRGDVTGGRWAATQRNRRSGAEPIAWQTPGARGDLDAEAVPGATGRQDGETYIIEGLASAVQAQFDRPTLNHGFRLEFDDRVEFLSSDSTEGRPRLVLELEDAPRPTGPDLSVVLIERTPEYERYDTRGQADVAPQDGVAVPVTLRAANGEGKRWPDDGEEVTYRATVKNVGTAPADGFEAQWFIRELPDAIVAVERKLAPGESTTLELKTPFRSSHTDHRIQPVALRLFTKGEDADRGNDELVVQQAGLALGFTVTDAAAKKFAEQGLAWEDAIQRAVHRWNEVLCRFSRFSFAPAGALERVRVQRMAIGEASAIDLRLDGEILVGPDTDLMAEIARACGLVEITSAGVRQGSLLGDASTVPPSPDRFPGVLGGGETRSDALLAPTFAFPHERFSDLYVDPNRMDVGAGLSATDVYALNRNLGRRRGFSGDYLYDVPGSVLVTLTDPGGRRLGNQELTLYALRAGSFAGASKLDTIRTGESGTILLPKRDPGVPPGSYTPTGHQLLANPFGRVDATGANSAIAIRGVVNGVEAVAVLKLWQVLDAVARSRQPLAMVTVVLPVPSTPLAAEALALAAGSAKLSTGEAVDAITDNDPATGISAPAGGAIDIDLGREVALGEIAISLAAETGATGGFDLLAYRAGEKPETGRLFAREGDLTWSLTTRGQAGRLKYYGMPMRARYVRVAFHSGAQGWRLLDLTCTPGR